MKCYLLCLPVLMCAACSREAGQAAVTMTTAAPAAAALDGVPSEAEIAAFVTRLKDPADANKSTVLNVTFRTARLMPEAMEQFRERGKIPFTISVDFRNEVAEGPRSREEWGATRAGASGRFDAFGPPPQVVRVLRMVNVYSIMEGHADIAVLDADGKLVVRERKDLDLLCPS